MEIGVSGPTTEGANTFIIHEGANIFMHNENPSERVNQVSLLPTVRFDKHANQDTHGAMEFEETENDVSERNESLPIVHRYDFEIRTMIWMS